MPRNYSDEPLTPRQHHKHPAYLRPVPPLYVENIPLCADTEVYEEWTDEAEEEALKRAAKRRKTIQDAASGYFRGEPIFILSASLRGPFDDGWVNPWAQKRCKASGEKEIPETAFKPSVPHDAVVKGKIEDDGHMDKVLMPQTAPMIPAADAAGEAVHTRNIGTENGKVKLQLSAKKVQEWLKCTEPAGSQHIHVHSSPTPLGRPHNHEMAVPEKVSLSSDAFDPRATFVTAQASNAGKEDQVEELQSCTTQSTEPPEESPKRAESAIMEHKRRSIHKVPSPTHLLDFEYRRPRSRGQSSRERMAQSSTVLAPGRQTARPAPNGKSAVTSEQKDLERQGEEKTVSMPMLEAETSKTSSGATFPMSAQIVALPEMAHRDSVADGTADMLHSVQAPSHKLSEAPRESVKQKEKFTKAEKESEPNPGTKPPSATAQDPVGSLNKTPERELETQEMIAAIKPFDFSTIKKPPKPAAEHLSPSRVVKKPSQPRKKASFALNSPPSDQSQRSIKASMKTTKLTTSRPPARGPAKSLFGVPVSPERDEPAGRVALEDSLPSVSAMFETKSDPPKSILKSSAISAAATMPTATNTTRASEKNDAQKVRQIPVSMDGFDDDADFDLDGAMDELGSYLGTWDPDVAARILAACRD